MSGNYFPNNWEAWAEMPEDFLATPTWEEFEDWKLRGWELPSSDRYNNIRKHYEERNSK